MRDLNKVQVTGRLGADPEVRYTDAGTALCTFRLASNQRWRAATGETVDETEWFRVVAWSRLAEICGEYLRKGMHVYLEGRLRTRQYTQEGQKRFITEVVASDMIMLDPKSAAALDDRAGEEGSGWRDASSSPATPAPEAQTPAATRPRSQQRTPPEAAPPRRKRRNNAEDVL